MRWPFIILYQGAWGVFTPSSLRFDLSDLMSRSSGVNTPHARYKIIKGMDLDSAT